jgi:hypothetical protein
MALTAYQVAQPDNRTVEKVKSACGWLTAIQAAKISRVIEVESFARDQDVGALDGEFIHILLTGAARIVWVDGQSTTVALLSPGLMMWPPRPLRAKGHYEGRAMKVSTVGRLQRSLMHQIVGEAMVDVIHGQLAALFTRYPSFTGLDLRTRVAHALLELADRFGAHEARGVMLTITPTGQDIADLVGASRPKVSAVMNDFLREGVLQRPQRHMILMPQLLKTVASVR